MGSTCCDVDGAHAELAGSPAVDAPQPASNDAAQQSIAPVGDVFGIVRNFSFSST